MNNSINRTLLGIGLFIALLLGLFIHRLTLSPAPTPEQLQNQGVFVYEQPRTLSPISLRDHTGQAFSEQQLIGQKSLVFFGYTSCPDVCPTTMAIMAQLANSGGTKDSQMLFVTLDAQRDTVEQIAGYVPYFHAEFIGLTGEAKQLDSFARQLNVAYILGQADETGFYTVDHSTNLILLDSQGRYAGFVRPPHSVAQLATALQALN